MDNNVFEDVINVLMEVKLTLQRLKIQTCNELLKNIDSCISKLAPLIDIYTSSLSRSDVSTDKLNLRDRTISLKENLIFSRYTNTQKIDFEQQQQQLMKVRRSFIKTQEEVEENLKLSSRKNDIIIDYFIFKYDLKLGQYVIMGRKNGEKTDRQVFLDLLTDERKRGQIQKLERTESMTNIFKVGEPFILPNCQEQQTKFLFAFGLHECGSLEKDIFLTETLCCFVTREFVLGELSNMMDTIAKVCFEQRVSQTSPSQDYQLFKIAETLNPKKTYTAIESVVEQFIKCHDSTVKVPNLTISRAERWQLNTLDRYIQRSSLRWSLVKKPKGKDQKCFMTLVMLYYFAICEHKIVILTQTGNKHMISQLMIGLIYALAPLTYIYPIVAGTITPHHMEFANSPVPLLFGIWGNQQHYSIAKSSLKKDLKEQKDMSNQQLKNQTLMGVFDLQDHTALFLQNQYKQMSSLVQKIQSYIQNKFQGPISQKLSLLTTELLNSSKHKKEPEWMSTLRTKIKNTQMYEYITSKIQK